MVFISSSKIETGYWTQLLKNYGRIKLKMHSTFQNIIRSSVVTNVQPITKPRHAISSMFDFSLKKCSHIPIHGKRATLYALFATVLSLSIDLLWSHACGVFLFLSHFAIFIVEFACFPCITIFPLIRSLHIRNALKKCTQITIWRFSFQFKLTCDPIFPPKISSTSLTGVLIMRTIKYSNCFIYYTKNKNGSNFSYGK